MLEVLLACCLVGIGRDQACRFAGQAIKGQPLHLRCSMSSSGRFVLSGTKQKQSNKMVKHAVLLHASNAQQS